MVAIRTGNENNKLVVLEIANRKDNVEIVGCRYSGNEQLEQLKKQAEREGGQLLILNSNEAAAGLSTLPSAVSNGKGKDKIETHQAKSFCKPCRRERFGGDDINFLSLYRIGSRLRVGC